MSANPCLIRQFTPPWIIVETLHAYLTAFADNIFKAFNAFSSTVWSHKDQDLSGLLSSLFLFTLRRVNGIERYIIFHFIPCYKLEWYDFRYLQYCMPWLEYSVLTKVVFIPITFTPFQQWLRIIFLTKQIWALSRCRSSKFGLVLCFVLFK